MKTISQNYMHRYAFLFSLLLGLTLWFIDALIDYLYFYRGYSTFIGLLLTDIPPHEIYIRASILFFFVVFGLLVSFYLKKQIDSDTRFNNIFNNVIPICITDNDYTIISANKSYQEIFGPIIREGGLIKCHESRPGPKCMTDECPLSKITNEGKSIFTCESTKKEQDGSNRYFIVNATPYYDPKNNQIGIIETFQDITQRRLLEDEREELIISLQEEKEKVKTLSGFLPICASCKKIRDDKGYWNQIESYIKDHSDADFSHGLCPECAEQLYGNFIKKGKDKPDV